MPDPSKKGNFSADIGQDVIQEALKSIAKHSPSVASSEDAQAAELERMKAEVKQAKEDCLRAQGDLDDYKKRAQNQKDEVLRFGVEKLLQDILPVADNLDRALEHAGQGTDFDALVKGLQMTRKIMREMLSKHGIASFSSVGQPFSPHLHKAIAEQESADAPSQQVLQEVLCGYTLNGRLVRPARVVISKSSSATSPAARGDPKA